MAEINLNVEVDIRERKAIQTNEVEIICGNKDYTVTFNFDSEWDEYTVKTGVFVYWAKGQAFAVEQPFSGNVCHVPDLYNTPCVLIGVAVGDLKSTTPAEIKCLPGILDSNPVHVTPPEDVYNKLLEEFKKYQNVESTAERAEQAAEEARESVGNIDSVLDSILAFQNSYLCAAFANSAVVDIQYYNGSMEDTLGNATLIDTGTVTEKYLSEEEMTTDFKAAYKALDFNPRSPLDRAKSTNFLSYHSDIDVGSAFTIELYGVFRPDNARFFECQNLVSLRRQYNYDNSETARNSDNTAYTRIYPYGAVNGNGAKCSDYLAKELTDPDVYWGEAQHLLMACNGSSITYYINGVLVSTVALNGYVFPDDNTVGDFYIGGCVTDDGTAYSVGDKIIRFRVFDAVPTADEAAALYAACRHSTATIADKLAIVAANEQAVYESLYKMLKNLTVLEESIRNGTGR